ncbi:MAG: hypothetical protein ABJD75_14160 [Parasphingorhabdus sp.]
MPNKEARSDQSIKPKREKAVRFAAKEQEVPAIQLVAWRDSIILS